MKGVERPEEKSVFIIRVEDLHSPLTAELLINEIHLGVGEDDRL